MSERRVVLVTGATGGIGRSIIPQLAATGRYEIRSGHRREVAPDDLLQPVRCVLEERDSVVAALAGVDTVVHLAADGGDRPFVAEMVPNNIVGPYHLCEAAVAAGCRRIVFASTNHTVGNYFHDHQLAPETVEPRPDSIYGVTKVYAESLGRFYVERRGLPSFFALRIGWWLPPDSPYLRRSAHALYTWLSPRDGAQLVACAIDAPTELGFQVFNATSDNDRWVMPVTKAKELLGYRPEDNTEDLIGEFQRPVPDWLVRRPKS